MSDDLIDRIYEAAFVPEAWPRILETLAVRFNSREGGLALVSDSDARWAATERCAAFVREAVGGTPLEKLYYRSPRMQRLAEMAYPGFVGAHAVLTPEELAADDYQRFLRMGGLEWQALTMVPLTDGVTASFSIERSAEAGPYDAEELARLDRLRPHLARAGLMAARLGLERAQATVSALAMLGLPAAVLSNTGRVLTANDLFEKMDLLFVSVAFGGVAIAETEANRLFQETIATAGDIDEPLVRSIPVKPAEGRAAAVVHVLPLRRAAHDIFSGADVLVAATEIKPDAGVPHTPLLSALFDLSPAEARVAAALAAGQSLKEIAAEMNIGFGSARTYLARIFGKTGTSQQSQLVALLKSAQPLMPGPG